MPMAYSWFRVYTGTVNDKKWPRIARDAGQSVGCVVSVWLALLECASSNVDRGAVDDFCPEDIDALYGYDDGTTESIVHAMRDRGLISPENRLTAWGKRQDIPTEETPEDRKAYKREWIRRKREESREAEPTECRQPVDTCRQPVDTVDTCRQPVDTCRQPVDTVDTCRQHIEKRREDKNIKYIKHTPLTPQGGTGVGVSTPAQTSSPLKARETPGPDPEPKPDPKPKPEPPAEDTPQAPDTTTGPQVDTTHGNPAWKEFNYLYSLWPNQQGKEKAWREYAYLRARHLVPESYVLAEVIARFKAEDRKWKRGYVPMMNNWLHDRRWDDVPEKAPAKSYAPDENGRQMYVDEADQNYTSTDMVDISTVL